MSESGRLTAAKRLEVLLDAGSLESLAPENGSVIVGRGAINGRAVYIFAQSGGVVSGDGARAMATAAERAWRGHAPLISLFDSPGYTSDRSAFAELRGFFERAHAADRAPHIAVVMGSCLGPDAILAARADFAFMVKGRGSLFVTGPDVVAALGHDVVSDEELGGAAVHAEISGLADGIYNNDVEALLQIRRLVDFLPGHEKPWPISDDPARVEPSLNMLVPDEPARGYDVKEAIIKILDEGDFFEVQDSHARNIVVGFGRLGGETIGVVANQPLVLAGALDVAACGKAARFVNFCGRHAIPTVNLIDVPGFLPGPAQEHAGLAREAAALISAYGQARGPQVNVVLRNAIGAAYLALSARRECVTYTWPTARIAPCGGQRGHEDPRVLERAGEIVAVFDPQTTRPQLIAALKRLRGQR
jgi:propionyl-CoA carboxylase beta chain